jgi:hypothetical protein
MSLSIPAGLHANFLILLVGERSKMLLAVDFNRELIVHVAIAAAALFSVAFMTSAPPLTPCITAELPATAAQDRLDGADGPQPGTPLSQELSALSFTPSDCGGAHRERSVARFMPTSPQGGSRMASGVFTVADFEGSQSDKVPLQLLRERARLDRPLLAEVWGVLRFPHFWKALLAFAASMGAFIVYYLLVEEFLDSSGGATVEDAISFSTVAGSFGAIALPACTSPCLHCCLLLKLLQSAYAGPPYLFAPFLLFEVGMQARIQWNSSWQGCECVRAFVC